MARYRLRDVALARKAKRYGIKNSLRTVLEARRAGLPVSLAFALVEQETDNGANVFGHDPVQSIRGGPVTKARYLTYRARRRAGFGMQGVGPLQLTWWATQDEADRLGGCWKPAVNLRVGLGTLAGLIRQHGYGDGVRRYNGSGPAAVAYSASVRARAKKWHRRLA